MLNIQVKDRQPEIVLDKKIRTRLAVFEFSHRHYIEGLHLAGVPDEAMETLQVKFKKSGGDYEPSVYYDDEQHQVLTGVSPKFKKPKQPTDEPWHRLGASLANTINYKLAYTAQLMAEDLSKHPDAVKLGRLSTGGQGRIAIAGAAATTGAIIGEEVGQALHGGSLIIGVLGATAAFVAAGSVFIQKDKREGVVYSRDHLAAARDGRAQAFANSDAAFELFQNVVQLEFLPD